MTLALRMNHQSFDVASKRALHDSPFTTSQPFGTIASVHLTNLSAIEDIWGAVLEPEVIQQTNFSIAVLTGR